ncbi:MAG: sodium ion-translocating decarboxylase subunit beta [Chloroflexota bacterium]|nr:sodium ion-translocating decarboxylase subunit beta [Chloroflexota bacterium]MEC7270869.1 sodium ion-translocating decarboxylase subunit beta [Chloroflexota bacterium]MEC8440441.1 sodium ion-translocating decarboxylase subunit beta [Chloroflexota bacterium]MEC8713166.1 sodium ion-translocating decarboxylase subunit beta [Chloroflexota bacterium]MEC8750454.1 sodium ion-translocating decarboxylase subunit beta [Chloroflexota bacterium]
MWLIAGFLMYFGIAKKKEPLLLVPISFGVLLANLPLGELVKPSSGEGEPMGFLLFFQENGLHTDLLPLLVFLGLGALTDFTPVISNPKTLLLGAAAQAGVFIALIGALLIGLSSNLFDFGILEASAIGIIGGADGPTTIFIASRMKEIGMNDIVGATAVAAYSYMALVPLIQPPIIKFFTTQKERQIVMPPAKNEVSKRAKILFPIICTVVISILVPKASPLVGILMFGNLLRECGVVERLSNTAQNELMNIVVIILGLAVGSTMPGEVFLQFETIAIFILGLVAFISATIAGILLAKLMNLVSKEKINPMIGAAGVSAVPMAARVVQEMAQKEKPGNMLLMHAMGPNIAGVIGTATVAGVLLSLAPGLS